MSRLLSRICLLVITLLLVASAGSAQTREFLRAIRAEARVRVLWDSGSQRIVAAADDDAPFRPLVAVQPFLTEESLTLSYPRLNPLRIAVAAALAVGSAPAETVTPQLRALMSKASETLPSPHAQAELPRLVLFDVLESCPNVASARRDADTLLSTILVTSNSPTVGALLASWRQAIDDAFSSGQTGPDVVAAALSRMDAFVDDLDARVSASTRTLTRIDAEIERPSADDPCARAARRVYESLILANPRARLSALAAVRSAVTSVRDALRREYLAAARWQGAEFLLVDSIRPPRDGSLATVIRVTDLRLEVDEASGAVVAVAETTASETLVTQRASKFAREFAVASVVGTITRQQYGTTSNGAGTTVVGRLASPIASFEPAFLLSFVCRCQTGPLVAPMLQVGITTSKEVPAILAGGGLRLFGLPRGDVALGIGAMIGWVKDLGSLRVGDAVGGTADIEADLRYAQRQGFYAALQYKF